MNHTPGPWYAQAQGGYINVRASIAVPIAEIWMRGNKPQQVADANLIAAAPNLLDACTQAEAAMSIVEPRADKGEYLRILGVLRSAVARAKGAA